MHDAACNFQYAHQIQTSTARALSTQKMDQPSLLSTSSTAMHTCKPRQIMTLAYAEKLANQGPTAKVEKRRYDFLRAGARMTSTAELRVHCHQHGFCNDRMKERTQAYLDLNHTSTTCQDGEARREHSKEPACQLLNAERCPAVHCNCKT